MFVPQQRISAALVLALIIPATTCGADGSRTSVPSGSRSQVSQAGGREPTYADQSLIFASGPVQVAHQEEFVPPAADAAAPQQLLPPRPMARKNTARELIPMPAPPAEPRPMPPAQAVPEPVDATAAAPKSLHSPPGNYGPSPTTQDYYYKSTPGYETDIIYTPHYSRRRQVLPHNWFQAEALLWWTSDVSVPTLATASPSTTPLNQAGLPGPNSQVLFGGGDILDDPQGGFRLRAGHWMNDCDGSGFVAEFLMLMNRGTDFHVSSDGNPILARPYNDVSGNNGPNGVPAAHLFATPGTVQGAFHVNAESRMYGAAVHYWGELYDANQKCSSCGNGSRPNHAGHGASGCDSCCDRRQAGQLGLKFGPRFYHLDDDLSMNEQLTDIATGDRTVLRDVFDTENSFLGLELGLRGRRDVGRLSVDAGAQLAVGATRQELDIHGDRSTIAANGVVTRSPQGFFAQQSNSGSSERTRFSLVPGFDINLGWELDNGWRATAGYNLMLWTNVLRAGEQINENILPPGMNGPNPQASGFRESDYLAHGLSFGVEKRY